MPSPSSRALVPVVRVVEEKGGAGFPMLHLTLIDRGEHFGWATAASWEWVQKGWWYLNNIEVDEDWRSYGFGGLLLIRLSEELTKRGAAGIYVCPAGDLARLEKFYTKHGFEKAEGRLVPWQKKLNINGNSSPPKPPREATAESSTSGSGAEPVGA